MGKKILLADDSITIQKVIELTFSDEDFDVVTVGNGRLAIEKLHEVRPDVVLCDIIMPEKDGYEVCEYIKKDPTLSHVPVLLLTGAFEPFDQERAARVGCDGYLAKPFEPQTLITRVKGLLAQANVPKSAPAAAAAPAPPVAVAPPPAAAPAVPAPVAVIGQEFEPLTASGDFEPLDAVPFEPLASSAIEPEPIVEPETVNDYVHEVAQASPTQTIAPRAVEPEPLHAVAFIPEEPHAEAPPSAPASAPVVATAPAFEPVFIPDDDLPIAPEPLAEPEEFVAAAAEPEDRPRTGETMPPMKATAWTTATAEVPLEERAQASVEAAYGQDFGPSEAVLEDVTFEPEAPAAAAPQALDEDLGAGDQGSIFEAMGLDREAGARAQAELAESEPPAPEPLAEDVEWEEDAAGASEASGAVSADEPAGAEVLLDDDLSAPSDMAAAVEAAAAAVAAEEEPELEQEPELDHEPELEQELEPLGSTPTPVPPAIHVPPPLPVAAPVVRAAPPEPAPLPAWSAPATLPEPEESFEEVMPTLEPQPEASASSSRAAEVGVPVDMVAQIAQRVVGQLSEKVIREIAWEVIPELAEALLKKEIERLKAELEQLPR